MLLLNGIVYLGFGSRREEAAVYNGWILALDAATLRTVGALPITKRRGSPEDGLTGRGGVWQGGGGLAGDVEDGCIYAITGNGEFVPGGVGPGYEELRHQLREGPPDHPAPTRQHG